MSKRTRAKRGTRSVDMTKGPIAKTLLLFALPLLGSSLIQLLYSTVDLMFVGNFIGTSASAAVGAGVLVLACVLGLFNGLGLGAGVVIANRFGAKDANGAQRAMGCAIFIGLVGGALLTPTLMFLTPSVLTLLATPAEVMDMAVSYLGLYFTSLIPMIMFNMGAGALRAVGNSKDPMIAQLIGGIANICVDALFIAVLQWGVVGAALATVCSQTVAAALVLYRLATLEDGLRLKGSVIRFESHTAREIFAIGLPASVQMMVVTLSNLVVQHSINALGPVDLAAFTNFFKVENFIYMPIVALAQAVTTFTSQNLGAHEPERGRRGHLVGMGMNLAMTAGIAAVLLLLGEPLFRAFNPDPVLIQSGCAIAAVILPMYLLYTVMEGFSGVLRGAGHSKGPMAITITMVCGVRAGLLTFLPDSFQQATQVAWVYPISWAAASVCMVAYYLVKRRSMWGRESTHVAKEPA